MRRSGFLKRGGRLTTRKRPGWDKTRGSILRRDHHLCRHCGGRAVDVHHIVKRSAFGVNRRAEADDDANLISLCRKCHARTDAAYIDGRLCIRSLGDGKFAFEVVYGFDKFAVRTQGG